MKTMPGPGSSSRLFKIVSSLYLKLSNEGMALVNQIEVTTYDKLWQGISIRLAHIIRKSRLLAGLGLRLP